MTIPKQIVMRDKKVYLTKSGSSKLTPCHFGEDLSSIMISEDNDKIVFLSRSEADRQRKRIHPTPFNENYHGRMSAKSSIYDYNANEVAGDFNYMDPTEPQNVERMYSPYAMIHVTDNDIFIVSRRRMRNWDL